MAKRKNNNKIILHITGNSCTGKSTIVRNLKERLPGAYNVAYDKLKWQLAGYDRDKDKELIKRLSRGLFEAVCKEEIPILLEAFMNKKGYKEYLNIAKKYGYIMHTFKLTAPKEVLIQRFRKRIEEVTKKGARISITNEKLFKKKLNIKDYLPPKTITLDTSQLTEKEITTKIIESFSYPNKQK